MITKNTLSIMPQVKQLPSHHSNLNDEDNGSENHLATVIKLLEITLEGPLMLCQRKYIEAAIEQLEDIHS